MRLRYGSYVHDLGSPAVAIARQTIFNDAQVPIGYTDRWDINGMLTASTQAALNAKIVALERAYSANGRDATLLLDSGSASAHVMRNSSTISGVRVVAPPSYPAGGAGEFATYRTFNVSLEAETRYQNTADWLLSFEESLSFSGTGGPVFGFLEPLQDKPVKQKLKAFSLVRVTQSGKAVGHGSYPDPLNISPPLWPDAELEHQRLIVPGSPKRLGPASDANYIEYPVSWTYQFESANPLRGKPRKWKG